MGLYALLSFQAISNFYKNGFLKGSELGSWPRLWNKQFRMETRKGDFIKLNRFRSRFNFKVLRHFCQSYAPKHLYMTVLDWLMPERVGEKRKANRAYPIGGEYVVDVDAYLNWRPHSHYKGMEGVCIGCLSLAYDATLELLWKIKENYKDIHVVFSGRRGFHIHILDFNVRDWTLYNEKNPLKSHEVARFKYTKHLKDRCSGFDRYHFILSSDVMRVITFPGSLNGETRLICSYLGDPKEFEKKQESHIVWESNATNHFYDFNFMKMSKLRRRLLENLS